MIHEFTANSADNAYVEALWKMRVWGIEEQSRNGPVLAVPTPVCFTLTNPTQRVLRNSTRDANPFFHVFEALWMMAGENDARKLEQYNRTYLNYAEENGKVWGAYGHRWRHHFGKDQILEVADILRRNPNDRRAVIAMWDPHSDLNESKADVPCNTHIYFRIVDRRLDMTVCNRSNDIIWGMLGANIVHMTMLQELIAADIGVGLGVYRVFTQNAHIYDRHRDQVRRPPEVEFLPLEPLNLLPYKNDTLGEFLYSAKKFVNDEYDAHDGCTWIRTVAVPMKMAWNVRKGIVHSAHHYTHYLKEIACPQWRTVCEEWCDRREKVDEK